MELPVRCASVGHVVQLTHRVIAFWGPDSFRSYFSQLMCFPNYKVTVQDNMEFGLIARVYCIIVRF